MNNVSMLIVMFTQSICSSTTEHLFGANKSLFWHAAYENGLLKCDTSTTVSVTLESIQVPIHKSKHYTGTVPCDLNYVVGIQWTALWWFHFLHFSHISDTSPLQSTLKCPVVTSILTMHKPHSQQIQKRRKKAVSEYLH